jgi:outer membrane lipoprotein carrier protein
MRVLFFSLFLAWPLMLRADATAELVERLSGLKSMSGEFRQTVLDQDDSRLQEASGTMVVARPNRFRWHTRTPFEQLVVSDGNRVWIYDVDLEQVVVKPLAGQVSRTPALLFGGTPESVADSFDVERLDSRGETETYQLLPREEEPMFRLLEVTFDGPRPQSMRLEDSLGQKTTIEFLALQMNAAPDDAVFEFTPPEGADVIRQTDD